MRDWLPLAPDATAAQRRWHTAVRLGYPWGAAVHVAYIAVFAWWGVWPMTVVNVVSVLAWVLGIVWARRGWLSRSLWPIYLEVVVHALLVWVFLGWGFGIQYLLVAWVGLTAMTSSVLGLRARVGWSVVLGVLFAVGYYYTEATEPLYEVPAGQLAVLNLANIATMFTGLAVGVGYVGAVTDRAEAALAVEHARSERLLKNVLPVPIAERLKEHEEVIADGVDGASVLFADIVGFTSLSAQRNPDEVVAMLNGVFTRLDGLVDEFGLEKIKTIGDAYMVAAGIPVPREDHAQVLARFALAARDELAEHNLTADVPVELRIGINSGPVVAGVIGRRRFLYDLWGDTVNTASRMESHGIPGQIQITDATRDLLDGHFACTERGVVDVKGKGPTHTWLLDNERSLSTVG
jgi:guanylate cyclase